MPSNYLLASKESNNTKSTDNPSLTSEDLEKWNKLIAWGKAKGYAGKPELDHDPSLREKVFNEYNKENPNDAIPISRVQVFQKEILKYKQKALEEINANLKKGINQLGEGSTPANFMNHISQDDGIFGQVTSQFPFPSAYINGKRIGFAPKVNMQEELKKF